MNKNLNTQTRPKAVFPLPVKGITSSLELPQAATAAIISIGMGIFVEENTAQLKGLWKHLHFPLPGQDELCAIFELKCGRSKDDAMDKARSLHCIMLNWK